MALGVERVDAAVVGLGALGSAAAYQLARRGASVVGYEQFALGHVRGASHDTSRIIRRTYPRPEYVRLADAAYRDWAALEEAAGERFVTTTGGVTFCVPGEAVTLEHYAAAMTACDVPFEVLDGRDLARRHPRFRVPDGVVAIDQPDSGIVPAGRSTAVTQVLARVHGARLHAECPVEALEPTDGGVLVRSAAGTVLARRVVLCADAWTNRLLAPLGAALPLVTTLEQVSYFSPPDARAFTTGPVWVWDAEPCYYGFPCYGEPTVKAARDVSGVEISVDDRSFEPVPERLAELTAFLGGLLPGAGRHLRTVTCQYTLTPDRGFALGPLPGHPSVLVALGAGHAFKYAPTFGRILADLALTGRTTDDVAAFALDRPALAGADADALTPTP